MNYNDKLKAAIAEKNVIAARTQILIYLGHDEKEAKPVAVKIANEIAPYFTDPADPFFEADNNYLETPAENLWDQDFYNKLVAYLRLNFSKEKLELAQRVILKLRSNGVRDFQVVSTVHRQETPVRPRVNSIPEKKIRNITYARNIRLPQCLQSGALVLNIANPPGKPRANFWLER